MSTKRSPTDFIRSIFGKPVIVKLHNGDEYLGVLGSIDGFLNIALEQTEARIFNRPTRTLGDCFIRGNNGKFFINSQFCIFPLNR